MHQARIKQIIETCLAHLTVVVTSIDAVEDGGATSFVVRTPDSRLLIGAGGENLRALNALIRRLVERQVSDTGPFLVDVNGYYGKRVREIKQQARLLADRARTFRIEVEMSPMNSYERMVVHALFAGDAEIYTQSRGEGRERHVVIGYRVPEKDVLQSDVSLL